MNKLKRAKKDFNYGGGTGQFIFEGKWFSVKVWTLTYGVKTEIIYKEENCFPLGFEFDGRHHFNSNDQCIEQLTGAELIAIMTLNRDQAFKAGVRSKVAEFRKCLDL